MSNLENYKKHASPPDWAKREIQAGRLKGKTDINPQWRLESLTEMFGMVGFGWKYTIDSQRIVEGGAGEKVAFVDISLYVKVDGIWSDAIIGIGGSSFVANEKAGAYTSDEAFKMALTDAISVACKQIGIGSAVYSGSKYPTQPIIEDPMTEAQKLEIIKLAGNTQVFSVEQAKEIISWVSSKPRSREQAQRNINRLKATITEKQNV